MTTKTELKHYLKEARSINDQLIQDCAGRDVEVRDLKNLIMRAYQGLTIASEISIAFSAYELANYFEHEATALDAVQQCSWSEKHPHNDTGGLF